MAKYTVMFGLLEKSCLCALFLYSKRELKLGVFHSFLFEIQDYRDTSYLKSKKLLIKSRNKEIKLCKSKKS